MSAKSCASGPCAKLCRQEAHLKNTISEGSCIPPDILSLEFRANCLSFCQGHMKTAAGWSLDFRHEVVHVAPYSSTRTLCGRRRRGRGGFLSPELWSYP
eukprot:s2082_g5.t1